MPCLYSTGIQVSSKSQSIHKEKPPNVPERLRKPKLRSAGVQCDNLEDETVDHDVDDSLDCDYHPPMYVIVRALFIFRARNTLKFSLAHRASKMEKSLVRHRIIY